MSITSAIEISLQIAAACIFLGLPIATALGFLLARRDFPGKALFNSVIFLPLVLPPVVTGFLLLDLLGRSSRVGGFFARMGAPVSFSILGAVVAAFVVGLPLYVILARTAFEAVDPRLDEISWTLGVSPRRTFFRTTLPLALPGIAAGSVMVFARSLGEFGATTVLAGNMEGRTRTIATAIYSLMETTDGASAARTLILASVAISVAALLAYEWLIRWHRRRLET